MRKFVGMTRAEYVKLGGDINKLNNPACFNTIREDTFYGAEISDTMGFVCGFIKLYPEFNMCGKTMCLKCANEFAKHNGKYILKEVKEWELNMAEM